MFICTRLSTQNTPSKSARRSHSVGLLAVARHVGAVEIGDAVPA
jgi:hypothetical protein